jgi:hypothetical protein
MELGLTTEVAQLREELNDHLNAINENTDEIETNFSYLINLEKKFNLLEKKLDKIMSMLAHVAPQDTGEKEVKRININDKEQQVFSILYDSPRALDCKQMASRLRRSETFVRYNINALLSKGIPISKHVMNRTTYFLVDPEFKELQCKQNILNLSKTLTLDCFDQTIL